MSIRAKRLILWYLTLRYQKYSQFPIVAEKHPDSSSLLCVTTIKLVPTAECYQI